MMLAFGVFLPLAIIFPLLRPTKFVMGTGCFGIPYWLAFHGSLMIAFFLFAVAAYMVVALQPGYVFGNTNHGKFGLGILFATLIELSLGILRPSLGNKWRKTWKLVHGFLGAVIFICAVLETASGVRLIHITCCGSPDFRIGHAIFYAAMTGLVVCSGIWGFAESRRNEYPRQSNEQPRVELQGPQKVLI